MYYPNIGLMTFYVNSSNVMYNHVADISLCLSVFVISLLYFSLPEGFNDVGGYSSAPFMRVGLPGESDCVFGHLCYYRLLRRTGKLDELRNSGQSRNAFLYEQNKNLC